MIKNSYLRVAIVYGFTCGVLVLAYFFTMYLTGNNPLIRMRTFETLIIGVCMLFAMGYYRDRINGGKLHFWQAITIGVATNLIGVLLATGVIFVYVQYFKPEIFTDYVQQLEKGIFQAKKAGNITEAVYQQYKQRIAETSLQANIADIVKVDFFLFFIATGILAAVMRRS
jgi:hypothetical protein